MKKYRKEIIICLSLAAAIIVIYAQVRHFDLTGYDDYVIIDYAKAQVEPVFSLSGAFTGGPDCYPYRVPLTMLSHMLDCLMFGSDYGLHHLVNVLLHIINTLLLFYVFRVSTGDIWKSACLAALFAVHPLNVEAVAWLPSRVTQLSGLFFILTAMVYLWYAAKPAMGRYAGVAFCYVAGLMAKPEIAYLPFVLLLMDFWPLERWQALRSPVAGNPAQDQRPAHSRYAGRSAMFLLKEKIPLLLLAMTGVVLTLLFYRRAPFYGVPEPVTFLKSYLPHAPLVYLGYLAKIMLPTGLSFFKPLATCEALDAWKVAGSTLFLASMTAGVIYLGRARPWLAFGWFWFLGTVTLPVALNIFRHETMAYRYAYLPGIGILVMLVWGGYDLVGRIKFYKVFLIPFLCALLGVFLALSWRQTGYWRDIVSLYENIIDAGQYPAEQVYYNLGDMMLQEGKPDQAIAYYKKALEPAPGSAHIHQSLGLAHARKGDVAQALAAFRKALELDPGFAMAHNNLANLLVDLGRIDEAIGHYRAALEADPSKPEVYNNLATVLARRGEIPEAIECLKKALEINPDYKTARENLERLLPAENRSR